MLNAIFRPIQQWPGKPTPSYSRKRSRFKASYAKTLEDLERELNAIRARNIVIQLDLTPDQIRNDGWPRSSARPGSPRVILTFQKGSEVISMPCDTFLSWEQNLRAITLTLNGLRMIDQYGVSQHGEQYKGFARLEAPAQESKRDLAIRFIATWAQVRNEDVLKDLDGAYRIAARRVHPDTGGSHDLFVQLQQHYQFLRAEGPGK